MNDESQNRSPSRGREYKVVDDETTHFVLHSVEGPNDGVVDGVLVRGAIPEDVCAILEEAKDLVAQGVLSPLSELEEQFASKKLRLVGESFDARIWWAADLGEGAWRMFCD